MVSDLKYHVYWLALRSSKSLFNVDGLKSCILLRNTFGMIGVEVKILISLTLASKLSSVFNLEICIVLALSLLLPQTVWIDF